MNIVTIVGKTKCGKSSVLKQTILELILNHNYEVKYESKFRIKHSSGFISKLSDCLKKDIENDYLKKYKDRKEVGQITCAGVLNGKSIVITTYGDSVTDIKNAFDKGLEIMGNIDFFVCGSHGKGQEYLRKRFNKDNIVEINKYRSNDYKEMQQDNIDFTVKLLSTIC